jgi:hypothetical protein
MQWLTNDSRQPESDQRGDVGAVARLLKTTQTVILRFPVRASLRLVPSVLSPDGTLFSRSRCAIASDAVCAKSRRFSRRHVRHAQLCGSGFSFRCQDAFGIPIHSTLPIARKSHHGTR